MAQSIAQKTLRDFLQETEDAINSSRIDVALANCQTILASFPESLEAQRLLGEVYLAQGRLEEALHTFNWVLTNDPENVLAYCSRAIVSEHMSEIETALDCYQQAYELSRGDGQIRLKFAKLSAQVGQQGFVFSRAGLARLYMRGDLLSQAIQEWEIVLTATPERLDARMGLLEVYWREGSLDRVEELATQVLQDVPNCEKALLLLAHVIASKDMAQAQALLRQVEALDPDLVMAQELFADMQARYPDDPFLKLLKKAPCVLNDFPAINMGSQPAAVPSSTILPQGEQVPILETNAAHSAAISLPLEDAQRWSKDAALLPPFPDGDLQQNNSIPWAVDYPANTRVDHGASNGNWRQTNTSGLEPSDQAVQLSSDITPMGSWTMQGGFTPSAPSQESQSEPWEMLQNALHKMSDSTSSQGQEPNEPQQWSDQNAVSDLNEGGESWQSLNAFAQSGPDTSDSWVSPVNNHGAGGTDWTSAMQEKNPPSWLGMLTQTDYKQMTSGIPPVEDTSSPLVRSEEVLSPSLQEPVAQQSVTSPESSSWAQELEMPSSLGDDEEFSFGPAWLRSLGAATLEEEPHHFEQSTSFASVQSTEAKLEEQSIGYALGSEFGEAKPEEQSIGYALGSEFGEAKPEEQPIGYALGSEFGEAKLEEQPMGYALGSEFGEAKLEEQSVGYALGSEFGEAKLEEQSIGYALGNEFGEAKLEEQPIGYALGNEFGEAKLEEQSVGYALGSEFGEAKLEEQSVTYDAWKMSESATQLATSDPWWASTSEPEKQPMVDPNPQIELAASESGKRSGSKPQPEVISNSSEKMEQDLIATLEELEQQLHAKGFIAMEPNSLSTIAQVEEAKSMETITPLSAQQMSQPAQEMPQKQALPSALTELGMMFHESVSEAKPVASSALPPTDTANLPAEPFWLQELRSGSMSESDESSIIHAFRTPIVSRPVKASPEQPNTPPVPEEAMPRQKVGPTQISAPSPIVSGQMEALNGQGISVNPFLENELETTMKRPAVRLQSMAQSIAPRDHASSAGQVRTRGRAESPVSKTVESKNLNYKERLLKGYQHQLVGDYDEAMQDYRLVIRGAPELLGEVISNLRALLKLAPKYSIGYRVLGDAYMHQGEYLQAMEAYNSALTMAKKARS
jgi:tetratricopeptide (TPR) repeat protein